MVPLVPDADFTKEVTDAALKLISASRTGEVEGDEIAREAGRESGDIDVYYALREADRRGDLECRGWEGGMGLPGIVRLPPGR
jgi:hypothetical protein